MFDFFGGFFENIHKLYIKCLILTLNEQQQQSRADVHIHKYIYIDIICMYIYIYLCMFVCTSIYKLFSSQQTATLYHNNQSVNKPIRQILYVPMSAKHSYFRIHLRRNYTICRFRICFSKVKNKIKIY